MRNKNRSRRPRRSIRHPELSGCSRNSPQAARSARIPPALRACRNRRASSLFRRSARSRSRNRSRSELKSRRTRGSGVSCCGRPARRPKPADSTPPLPSPSAPRSSSPGTSKCASRCCFRAPSPLGRRGRAPCRPETFRRRRARFSTSAPRPRKRRPFALRSRRPPLRPPERLFCPSLCPRAVSRARGRRPAEPSNTSTAREPLRSPRIRTRRQNRRAPKPPLL